jgi:methylated-DNA-[protein]-cysteine S-methyltransferase
MIWFDEMPSPVGTLLLVADSEGVRHIRFERERHALRHERDWQRDRARLAFLREQLEQYFAGVRRVFELPLAPRGSPFQLRVWAALGAVPFGSTVSYSEIARRIGDPGSVRAVGAANGRNPLPIAVPCHRVIGVDGSLVGFGGGLERKRWLLAHEGAVPAGDRDLFAR